MKKEGRDIITRSASLLTAIVAVLIPKCPLCLLGLLGVLGFSQISSDLLYRGTLLFLGAAILAIFAGWLLTRDNTSLILQLVSVAVIAIGKIILESAVVVSAGVLGFIAVLIWRLYLSRKPTCASHCVE